MVFPAVVEECDSAVDSFRHNPDGGLLVLCVAQVMTSKSQRGDGDLTFAEKGALGYPCQLDAGNRGKQEHITVRPYLGRTK